MTITVIDEIKDRELIKLDLKKFLFIRDGSILDISKFLRDDLSVNLELLELAIEIIISDNFKEIFVEGWKDYFEIRGVFDLDKKTEELKFLSKFMEPVVEEFSDNVEVIFNVQ